MDSYKKLVKENQGLTWKEWRQYFKLLDERARTKHNCHVTEFFLSPERAVFIVCFRPLGWGTPQDPNRYACKYLHFTVGEIKAMAAVNSLPLDVIAEIDATLPTLR
jgi:hypothetical protein